MGGGGGGADGAFRHPAMNATINMPARDVVRRIIELVIGFSVESCSG